MAELILEEIEECTEGIEEGMEGLEEAEQAEISAEVAEVEQGVSTLSGVIEELKSTVWPAFKSAVKIAADFGFATIVFIQLYQIISKAIKGDQDAKKKKDVIEALRAVIKTETDLNKKLYVWLDEHKDDTIILDGETIPLESVIETHVKPISEAADKAYVIIKALTNKIDGKVKYNIPTAEDVMNLIETGEEFCKAFIDLIEFIPEKAQKFKELSSFPLKKPDVEILTSQLKDARELPLW